MGTLIIGDVDDWIIQELKVQAKANHRSLEGEIRHVLTQRADPMGRVADLRDRTRQLLSLTAERKQTDSVNLLREDRNR